jgi:poly(A) polymerase Pap1
MSRSRNKASIEDFGEDDMPCPCTQCSEWFDLEDGMTNPRKDNEIICAKCARAIQEEVDKEEEIENVQAALSNAQWEVNDYKKQLHELGCKVPAKARVICYCGSLRVALEAFKKAEYESVLNGDIALLPCCMFVDIQREYGAESDYKLKADELHKRKIDICDEVFVLNVGGYIGESTRSEIEYAKSINKPIKYLEPC